MSVNNFFRRYGIELIMLSLSIGLGTWFSIPKATYQVLRLPDTLRVVTLYGATTYFQYKHESLGQQYDLVHSFAEKIGRPLVVEVAPSLERIHQIIESGAAELSITPELATEADNRFSYVGPELHNAIVLIQRKRSRLRPEEQYIGNVTDLIGKAIYTLPGSRFEDRLDVLGEQLGGSILTPTTSPDSTVSVDSLKKEDLISMVAARQIDYALVDKELARITARYYPDVDMTLEIGFPQRLRWVTRKDNTLLIDALNRWASEGEAQPRSNSNIYRKYLQAHKPNEYLLSHSYRGEKTHIGSGKISPFDALFREEATRLGWDWQVLASIAYQESNFTPEVIGRSGARGLMGIMPRTGQSFGATAEELLDPQVSVRVAVDCLLAFGKSFRSIEDVEQRMKLTLAAYNAGIAHVQDAQRLAEKYGHDPKRWDGNVEEYILRKSEAQYYRDPVCKYGYLRGTETYHYVSKVTERAKMYRSYTTQ